MKITATVNKSVDIELEVDDKFAPLANCDFWENNLPMANALANELEEIIENSEDDIIEVCGAFDPMGDVMFEN